MTLQETQACQRKGSTLLLYRYPALRMFATACLCAALLLPGCIIRSGAQPPPTGKLLLAHYMPWYSAKPFSPFWGWHWTMGKFQPDVEIDGRREAASHYYPLIGLYDSSDPEVLDCQCLLMKLSGIDGVIIDWYGLDDHLDYAINHRNTLSMVQAVKRSGLKFAICYEDSTVTGLIAANKLKAVDAVNHTHDTMKWLNDHWFQDDAYVKVDGKPVFLVFGNGYFQDDQWNAILAGLAAKPLLFTEAHQRAGSVGAFDWPHPEHGAVGSKREMDRFYEQSHNWLQSIPAAYPRFHDIYDQAGVHKSWGDIPDGSGKTFEATLERALTSNSRIVQIATWNDWGEGTQIEPSAEFGYRDLEAVQRVRNQLLPSRLPYSPADLRLPVRLLILEKRNTAGAKARLDQAKSMLTAGNTQEAGKIITEVETWL